MNTLGDPQPNSPQPAPWIEVVEGQGGPSTTARAIIGAELRPLPPEQRFAVQWGWNADSAREEANGRKQLFLAALHGGGQFEYRVTPKSPVLALHAVAGGGRGGVALTLLAAVDGCNEDEARQRAADLWLLLAATFPYDYELTPLSSTPALFERSGLELLRQVTHSTDVVEVRRFELRLSQAVLMGCWQSETRADEQVWRALSVSPSPMLMSVRLCPTALTTAEWPAFEALVDLSRQAETNTHPLLERHYQWARRQQQQRLQPWQPLFLAQLHLVVPGGVPSYLPRAIGSSLTWRQDGERAQPLYQVATPLDEAAADLWSKHLERLAFTPGPGASTPMLERLHLLAGFNEALTVFGLPYSSKGGLPGVTFL